MSSVESFITTFTVAGFTAEVTVPRLDPNTVAATVVEWSPRVPDFNRDFTPQQRTQYHRGLVAAIAAARSAGDVS